jgi:hypothetical protein
MTMLAMAGNLAPRNLGPPENLAPRSLKPATCSPSKIRIGLIVAGSQF